MTVLINELDSDTPGTDAAEFIELYDGGVGNTPLDGLVLVLYNGSWNTSYYAIDLDGYSTDADGYFLADNAGVIPAPGVVFGGNLLQNGQDAVALYTRDAASFPLDTPVSLVNIVDALVYDTADADDPGLLVLLDAGQPQVDESSHGLNATESNQRCANGSGGPRNTSTYNQWPPTPGVANECVAPPTPVAIHDIQGAAHFSPYFAQRVRTSGIVTVLSSYGFWMLEPTPDALPGTSEGIYVYQDRAPSVAVGDSVVATATVHEYYPGGYNTGNLSLTELAGPTIAIISHTNPLPAPVLFGPLGSAPPAEIIEDDATGDVETTGVCDSEQDGIDISRP